MKDDEVVENYFESVDPISGEMGRELVEQKKEVVHSRSTATPERWRSSISGFRQLAKRRSWTIVMTFLLASSIAVVAFLLGSQSSQPSLGTTTTVSGDALALRGLAALSESELRDVVIRNRLTVYWAGPQEGAKYSISVPSPSVAVVRYLPNGKGLQDSQPVYRVIGTYVQKDPSQAIRLAGSKAGNLGFTNIDGNDVFYVKGRPTNVYVAIKNKDIQIEIFDPGADQAIAMSLFRGLLRQIK